MDKVKFINDIVNTFKRFDVNDCIIKDNLLIVPIDKDKKFPAYKILFNFINDSQAECSSYFYLKDNIDNLLDKINDFNNESIIKFSILDNVLKVSISIIDLDNVDSKYIVKIISLMPSIIGEFEDDLLQIIK